MVNTESPPVLRIAHRGRAETAASENPATMPRARQDANFEELALPLLSALYAHAHWLARDQAEAEDLVQESLVKALRAFDSFQAGTNFKAWIFRILRNTFFTSRTGIAAMRTYYCEDHPGALEAADPSPTPEAILIQLNDETALYAALDELQPGLRDALLLCDVEELKYKEIALILDVPLGTVMSRVSRARGALPKILQRQSGGAA